MARQSKTAKLREQERRAAASPSGTSHSTQPVRLASELSISVHGASQSSQALPPIVQAATPSNPSDLTHPSPVTANEDVLSTSNDASTAELPDSSAAPPKIPSQTTSLINEFEACMPQLLDLLFEAEIRTAGLLEDCSCGRGKRTVTCFDCTQHPLCCEQCFISGHKHLPLHWAERWDPHISCFVWHNISALDPSFAINLGHSGDPCPFSLVGDSGKPLDLTLVTLNGIHRTRVRFCTCHGIPDRMSQLMSAGFMPATVKLPRTAFSFAVVDQFQRLQLDCKISAYDFCYTLRRATDDTFTSKTPDIFPQFVIVMQVWRIMMALKRLGQAHNIDDILSHRRARNLIVHCPVCPEPHFNLGSAWREIPELLRHLCQLQFTADGNHQANRYLKNTDPLSESLFAGRAHFPTDEILQEHLRPTEGVPAEKSTCTHLNAAEKQDRKKFRNMDITGIINIQCSHVFVKSSVDLQLGEKFTNTDLAFGLTLDLNECLDISDITLRHITARDLIFSYDIACGYLVKLLERFSQRFPHLVTAISRARGIIPAVHIQNHQDNCMYMYSGAYLQNAGHFHGETAEQYWVELNQLGPQTRQMNGGHRHDVIIDHHNNWAWKKTKQMPDTLRAEVTHARETYRQHKLRFDSLCHLHADKLSGWNTRDRSERKVRGKEVECVYRHAPSKVPSQKAILEALRSGESRPPTTRSSKSDAPSEAEFIEEGISLQSTQRELEQKITSCEAHSTITSEKEVKQESRKLEKRMEAWREQQQGFMPQVSADILLQASQDVVVSKQQLFLPSDYDASRRTELRLDDFASLESQLREGLAFDAITSVQQFVKCIESLKIDKRTNAVGQDQNTRANTQIAQVVSDRQTWINHYNSNRDALISLGFPHHTRSFPRLTIEDTRRTSVTAKRALGASRQFDGKLWGTQPSLPASIPSSTPPSYTPVPVAGDVSTQGAHKITKTMKRKATEDIPRQDEVGAKALQVEIDAAKVVNIEDGWIWRIGAIGKLSAAEIKAWEEEGDRVHWFRAEVEMERWREQWELKLVEFVRCADSFSKMAETWVTLADHSTTPSGTIYARKKAATYRQLCLEVETSFAGIQADEPTEYRRGEDIVEYIIRHRKTEVGTFHPKYTVQLFKVFN